MSISLSQSPRLSRRTYLHSRGSTFGNRGIEKNLGDSFTNRCRGITLSRSLLSTSECDNNLNKMLKNIPSDIYKKAKELVNQAVKDNKIFSINGPYDKIRKLLRERGWVEKISDGRSTYYMCSKIMKLSSRIETVPTFEGDTPKQFENEKSTREKIEDIELLHVVASQLVLNHEAKFIWTLRTSQINFKEIKDFQTVNHFRKAGAFTTKTGLIKSFNRLRWFEKDPDEVYPRSYILSDEGERNAFISDYQFTACFGLIKLVCTIKETSTDTLDDVIKVVDSNNSKCGRYKAKPNINYDSKEFGDSKEKVDKKYIEMAINFCQFYMKSLKNKDLDHKEVIFCSSRKWEDFFRSYDLVTKHGFGIDVNENIVKVCVELYEQLKNVHVQNNMDGYRNIWIVKPGAKSRGRGIYCVSKFSEIQNAFSSIRDPVIIQKYIEKPLLIYNTKFDIRQWFLVTNWNPLTIWWYRDSYIRFCSQQFTLNDFNESVHLSNNSIQHKYANGPRSEKLPNNNMWYWSQFDSYLRSIGKENVWKTQIVPSMKNIIIDIMLCSQEEIEDRTNSFEIYGADFMVSDEDFKTWLIEINSSPCMAPSTSITAKLTKNMIDDLFKVLFDRSTNEKCDTGHFELIFEQSPFEKPINKKLNNFALYGSEIKKPYRGSKLNKENPNDTISKTSSDYDDSILRNKLHSIISKASLYNNYMHRKSPDIFRRRSQTLSPISARFGYQNKLINYINSTKVDLNSKIRSQADNSSNLSESRPHIRKVFSQIQSNKGLNQYIKIQSENIDKKQRTFPSIRLSSEKSSDDNSEITAKKKVRDTNTSVSLSKRSNEETKSLVTKLASIGNNSNEISNNRLNQILNAYFPLYRNNENVL